MRSRLKDWVWVAMCWSSALGVCAVATAQVGVAQTGTVPVDGSFPGGQVSADTVDPDCPGAGLNTVRTTVELIGGIPCGSELTLNTGSVNYQPNRGICPSMIIIHPAHNTLTADPGSGMRGFPDGFVESRVVEYRCAYSYFLFLTWNHRCEAIHRYVAGRHQTFGLQPCEGSSPQ